MKEGFSYWKELFGKAGVLPGESEFLLGYAFVSASYGPPFVNCGVCGLPNDGCGVGCKWSLPFSRKLS